MKIAFTTEKLMILNNPVGYFEIPVLDMQRAVEFYSKVFRIDFISRNIDNLEMALFPFDPEKTGITGALVKGEIYKPSINGALLYFNVESIDDVLQKVQENKGEILYPKTSVGEYGFVAEFKDSESNRIGLNEKL